MVPLTIQHRIVRLFYEVAFLDSRHRTGMPLTVSEQRRLALLASVVGRDGRRRFRRKHLLLPARIQGDRAVIVNMSPGGMLAVTRLTLEAGDQVLVKVGPMDVSTGSLQHSFPCTVIRVGQHLAALVVSGIPLEVRFGAREARSLPGERPSAQDRTACGAGKVDLLRAPSSVRGSA